jgi:hypothetical protein
LGQLCRHRGIGSRRDDQEARLLRPSGGNREAGEPGGTAASPDGTEVGRGRGVPFPILTGLPGTRYDWEPAVGAAEGCRFVATCGGRIAGCLVLRDLGGGICGMEQPHFASKRRGRGVEQLARAGGIDGSRLMGRSTMTQSAGSSWKYARVARRFLDERRGAIPLGDEQVVLLLLLARRFDPLPERVIDLGRGDGFLARVVLSEFPTAQTRLIDHSEPMLERARDAMSSFSGRFEIRHGDLADPLPPQVGDGSFDLIFSGYAIHHLPTPR